MVAANAFAAEVVRVVASRGILLGPWRASFTGDEGGAGVVPAFLIIAAPAVDRVTRVGL